MATRAKKSAKKSAARKSTPRKSPPTKAAAKKPAAKKPTVQKAAPPRATGGRLAMSVSQESSTKPTKPKSNFCVDHGRLLRADRTCPVSTCRFHTRAMPE
jgi:hypothetical protein